MKEKYEFKVCWSWFSFHERREKIRTKIDPIVDSVWYLYLFFFFFRISIGNPIRRGILLEENERKVSFGSSELFPFENGWRLTQRFGIFIRLVEGALSHFLASFVLYSESMNSFCLFRSVTKTRDGHIMSKYENSLKT